MIGQALDEGRPLLMWGRTPYPHPGENLGTGNRCGHNPNKPEFHLFQPPEWLESTPSQVRKLLDAVMRYYDAPLTTLPTLGNLNGKRNRNGQPRQNRSEARAAEVLVMRAVILFTDFASLRVGTPQANGKFLHRSCVDLARQAGLLRKKESPEDEDEPSPRFWRAFRRLRMAGAFDVYLQYEEREDGSKRGRPAVKHVSQNWLVALGALSFRALELFRTWASNRIKRARLAFRENDPRRRDAKKARDDMRRDQSDNGLHTFAAKSKRLRSMFTKTAREEYLDQSMAYHAELIKQNPNAPPSQLARRVMREFPTFADWGRIEKTEKIVR